MNWKIDVVTMFTFTLSSLVFSFLNMFISALILIVFYLIDLLKPPFYSADEMEKPIVFLTPILVIGVTIYILLKLYLLCGLLQNYTKIINNYTEYYPWERVSTRGIGTSTTRTL
ncbi:hypothetical protein YN1551_2398 [Sulfolobus islandicus Y.N.15.51]|uniref:Uncharacterized protein n=1 Tax=Saccharolobus islandicus (strain Y.N.15.51 / Yellowstone \|nr:hypothetical protein [Sulfolobus islandicus]ACP49366.1 hypothetical protein YN1551_2398 [Sulfolobus islandicus Y.N.15.51]